jgi:predicted Zn-dependent peptidase
VDHPGATQALVRGSLPAPGRLDPDLPAFQVLAELLGGGFTSRLNARLREDLGITYGAGASLSLAAAHGRLLMDTTVAPGDAALALDELNDALLLLELRPPDEAEVEAARRALRLRAARAAERLDGLAFPYGEALSLGRGAADVAADGAAVSAVPGDAVRAAAAALAAADDVVWLVVGDAEHLQPALEEAGWIPDAVWSGRDLVEGRRPE